MQPSLNNLYGDDRDKEGRKRWPLWRQVSIALTLSVVVVAVVAGGMARRLEENYLSELIQRNGERATTLISATAIDAVIVEDLPVLQTIVDQSAAIDEAIAALKITNADGRILAAWTRDTEKGETDTAVTANDIVLAGQRFGSVMVEWDVEAMHRDADIHVRNLIFFIVASLLVMTAVLTLLGHFLVTVSVTRIDRRLQRLAAENGSVDKKPLPSYAAKEFQELNASVTELGRAWGALEEARAELERRVEERTAELSQANRELEFSNAELRQFAYVASHDLQEPLNLIDGYLNLLAHDHHGELSEEADEFIEHTLEAAERMKVLIKDLLAYSRIESKGKQLERAELNDALDKALANLKGRIVETKAQVTKEPLPMLKVDRSQITRVFQNLINNSLKFGEPGQAPVIHVSAQRQNVEWVISVKDNGIGVPEKEREKIFEIFQRLHVRDDFPGTGIGLSICKRIIERHGGRIWVESEPGEGCAFFFTLPASE